MPRILFGLYAVCDVHFIYRFRSLLDPCRCSENAVKKPPSCRAWLLFISRLFHFIFFLLSNILSSNRKALGCMRLRDVFQKIYVYFLFSLGFTPSALCCVCVRVCISWCEYLQCWTIECKMQLLLLTFVTDDRPEIEQSRRRRKMCSKRLRRRSNPKREEREKGKCTRIRLLLI